MSKKSCEDFFDKLVILRLYAAGEFLYTYKIIIFHPIHGLYFSAAIVYHRYEVTKMLRMEIALFLVLALVAYMYFSAERKSSPLHRTFSVLLVTALVHLVFDALTIYTPSTISTPCRAF